MTEDQSQQSALEEDFRTIEVQAKELMRDQRYAEALDLYSAFIDKHPAFQRAYAYRAYVYHVSGDLARAIQDHTTFIEFDPITNGTYDHRGLVYYEAGDYEGALQDFNRSIERYGGNERNLFLRGRIHAMRDEVDLAIADYIKAFRKGASDAEEIHTYMRKYKGMNLFDYLDALGDEP